MNEDTKIILSLLRDIQTKLEQQLSDSIDKLETRIAALETQHHANFPSRHSVSGHIYGKVSADEALPKYLLNKEIMLDCMANYQKNGPSPLTDNRQKQLAENQKKVPNAESDYLKEGYSTMREVADPANTDLYYFREMEALLAKELYSRGESLFTEHEPLDPRLVKELKDQEVERGNERRRKVDRGSER